jgi:membrane protein DedA with SNARE-associated domain
VADSILDIVEGAMDSPWVYLAILAFAAIDAFFPIVPSETLVISAGVFAASDGEPIVVGIIRFSFFDAIAALTWATYSTLVGYIGGQAFEDEPWKGLGLGLGIAIGISAAIELVRHVRRPRTATP